VEFARPTPVWFTDGQSFESRDLTAHNRR